MRARNFGFAKTAQFPHGKKGMTLKMSKKNILVLAPHTDDGELGCGGTISKLIEEGNIVWYAVFSICEDSVPIGFPKDQLETELKKATNFLGIDSDKLFIHRYPVRRMNEYRQNILDDMIKIRKEINPDIVFLPSNNDIHQDHHVIASEGIRAFKQSSLLGYELVWNNFTMNTSAFVKLSQCHIDKKVGALSQYATQQNIRSYMSRDFIESMSKIRGVQVNAEYAEAFEAIRWIL